MVNETGQPGIQLDRCRKMKFMKRDLLAVTDCAGNESYIDLKVNRTYREKPVVLSFGCMELPYGGVELLKVGAFFSAVPENRMSPCEGGSERHLLL